MSQVEVRFAVGGEHKGRQRVIPRREEVIHKRHLRSHHRCVGIGRFDAGTFPGVPVFGDF